MSKKNILICDDSSSIHSSLTGYLQDDDLNVISVYNGEDAIKVIDSTHVDVIVLDIMLPGIDGFEVCRRIRKNSSAYIIMLSAKNEENDRILGLELGADDYVPKPFSPREMSIRIRKALKRIYNNSSPKVYTLAELTVYPDSCQAFVDGVEIKLSSKEILVLSYMLTNVGKVLSREHILNAAWGYEYFGDTRVVDTMIKTLRKKIMIGDVHFAINTIYGAGYRLVEQL